MPVIVATVEYHWKHKTAKIYRVDASTIPESGLYFIDRNKKKKKNVSRK